MAEPRSRPSFARRIAAARPRKKKCSVWDDKISGLGMCIYPSGARSFFLRRQLPNGRVRSVTLGPADRMSVPQARQEARRLLPTLLDLPEKGQGPRYPGRSMAEFTDEFLERHARHWNPLTAHTGFVLSRSPAAGCATSRIEATDHLSDLAPRQWVRPN